MTLFERNKTCNRGKPRPRPTGFAIGSAHRLARKGSADCTRILAAPAQMKMMGELQHACSASYLRGSLSAAFATFPPAAAAIPDMSRLDTTERGFSDTTSDALA